MCWNVINGWMESLNRGKGKSRYFNGLMDECFNGVINEDFTGKVGGEEFL